MNAPRSTPIRTRRGRALLLSGRGTGGVSRTRRVMDRQESTFISLSRPSHGQGGGHTRQGGGHFEVVSACAHCYICEHVEHVERMCTLLHMRARGGRERILVSTALPGSVGRESFLRVGRDTPPGRVCVRGCVCVWEWG